MTTGAQSAWPPFSFTRLLCRNYRIAGAAADDFVGTAPPIVRLDGLSRTRRRTAALLAFGSGPSQWVSLGATIEGVTLVEVGEAKVVLETVAGRQVLGLGDSTSAASTEAAPANP